MHLVVNATELGRQRGGNESYVAGVIEGLASLNPSIDITLLTCNWGRPLDLPFPTVEIGPYRRLPFLLWQQTRILKQLKPDWYLANFFLPPVLPCKGAVFVYDVSFRAHPDYFPRSVALYMNWLTGLAIRKAERVLTISQFSRRELLRFYTVDEAKVSNTLGGVSPKFQPKANSEHEQAILARYGVAKPYIFALGNIHPRKNLGRLLDAYISLKTNRSGIPAMVWGGLQRWDSGELLEKARAAEVILPGFIAQEDLPTFYRQTEMLVYPSLYEGFGLPPIEAMACGAPVVCSNITSLPEVVGDAALTVNPTDTQAITTAMARILDNPTLQMELRQAGLKQAAQFTWKRTAQLILEALGHT